MSRHQHTRSRSGGSGSRRNEGASGNNNEDDAPGYCKGASSETDNNNCETNNTCDPSLLRNNNYDSSDENRDAESTASGSDTSETDRRLKVKERQIMVAQLQDGDNKADILSVDESNHETKNNNMIRCQQQRGEQELLDEILYPTIDLQITSSDSSDILRPNPSMSSNDSGLSLPEQILQHRLQRKPKLFQQHKHHGQYVRYQSKSPEQHRRKAPIVHVPLASTPFSDDEFENDNASTVASSNGASNDYVDLRRRLKLHEDYPLEDDSHASSPLASLPQKPICRFPEEADRKRIVGCLAVVLASSYAYETAPHLLIKETIVDGSDVEGFNEGTLSESGSTSLDHGCGHRDIDTNNGDIDSEADSCGTSIHPHLQLHKKQQHLIEQSRKHKHRSQSLRNRGYSSGSLSAKNTPPAASSNPTPSFSFNTSAATRIFDKVGLQNPPPSLSTELAEIRHRIRRHAILSELLISSAEMLLLDPSHAKAFLPMLDGLLTKVEGPQANNTSMDDRSSHENINSDGTNRQSWKGRGFGGGGLAVANMMGDEDIPMQPSDPTINDIPLRTMQLNCVTVTTSSSSLTSDVQTRESSNISSTNTMHEEGGGLKSANVHEPSQSSSRVNVTATAGDHCDPSLSPSTYAPLDTAIIEGDLVAPFLQTLTPGAGFQCIALLLLNHLLRDGRGYDARVRHAFKRLAVIVISHELKVGGILCLDSDDDDEDLDAILWGKTTERAGGNEYLNDANELALLATRKFEALEHAIAGKLISLSADRDSDIRTTNARSNDHTQSPRVRRAARSASSLSSSTHGRIALAPKETITSSQYGVSREQLLRGIKVGTAGAVGATLFALTGGLAAPGIAAGLAAVGK